MFFQGLWIDDEDSDDADDEDDDDDNDNHVMEQTCGSVLYCIWVTNKATQTW